MKTHPFRKDLYLVAAIKLTNRHPGIKRWEGTRFYLDVNEMPLLKEGFSVAVWASFSGGGHDKCVVVFNIARAKILKLLDVVDLTSLLDIVEARGEDRHGNNLDYNEIVLRSIARTICECSRLVVTQQGNHAIFAFADTFGSPSIAIHQSKLPRRAFKIL